MSRNLTRYLFELAWLTVRERGEGFRLNMTYLSWEIDTFERPAGFLFQDIVEHFCWISGCAYHFDDSVKPDRWLYVRLPRSIF